MGLFSSLFSSKPDYPQLDPESPIAKRLHEIDEQLVELAEKIKDPLEVIPSEHAAYVFIGKPPSKFGLAWIHDGKVSGLNTLIEEHGVTPAQINEVIQDLRKAYEKCQETARFSTEIEGHNLIVNPSKNLEHDVHEIIEKITH
jgi:hypothetical protein